MSPYVRRRSPLFPAPAGWLLAGGLALGLGLIAFVVFVVQR